jgi:hypothetical protein
MARVCYGKNLVVGIPENWKDIARALRNQEFIVIFDDDKFAHAFHNQLGEHVIEDLPFHYAMRPKIKNKENAFDFEGGLLIEKP